MLTAVVTQSGQAFSVHLTGTVVSSHSAEEETISNAVTADSTPGSTPEAAAGDVVAAEGAASCDTEHVTAGTAPEGEIAHASAECAAAGPNPIVPEIKEVLWGAGAFIVFALIMRYVAFPRLKKGMDARYAGIRSDHESADAARAAARAEVEDYQRQLATVKAEAAARIDTARQQLETQRGARLAEVNGEIAELKAAAVAENEAARAAVQDQIHAAVADVASSAIELAVGKRPDTGVVDRVVNDVMSVGAAR